MVVRKDRWTGMRAGTMAACSADVTVDVMVESRVCLWAAEKVAWKVESMEFRRAMLMVANWVALSGASSVVVMVDSKVDWKDFPRVERLVVH